MKTIDYKPAFRALFVAGISSLALLAGCAKSERKELGDSVKETYQDTKAAMANAWEDVKDYGYEKRDDFRASAKSLEADLDVKVSQLRANYSEAQASASRKAAMEELKNAESDCKEKSRALGTATADTWDSAKKNAQLAWDRLQAAYYKARAD